MDDAMIIELYWKRDEAAIESSRQKYGAFCRSIALNILDSREDAEECVSDTWLNAWNAMPPQRPNVLIAFFGRITRNLSISRYRREHAKKRDSNLALMLAELEECVPSNDNVECAAESAELSGCINAWLMTLKKEERALFLRRYWYGEGLSELARACGLSAATLASRMYRLRQSLKALLIKEGIAL